MLCALKKKYTEPMKNITESLESCLLNSTANPAKFGWKWAGLAGGVKNVNAPAMIGTQDQF